MADIFESQNLRKPLAEGVRYDIPRRTLACSDVAIARLQLAPGMFCPWNKHPGTELLIALTGRATVEIKRGRSYEVLGRIAAGDNIAHYASDQTHRIVNEDQDQTAELLVIRFYGEGRGGLT